MFIWFKEKNLQGSESFHEYIVVFLKKYWSVLHEKQSRRNKLTSSFLLVISPFYANLRLFLKMHSWCYWHIFCYRQRPYLLSEILDHKEKYWVKSFSFFFHYYFIKKLLFRIFGDGIFSNSQLTNSQL